MSVTLRPARPEDAAIVARLCDMADEGLPRLIWAREVTPERDLWAVAEAHLAALLSGPMDGHLIVAETKGAVDGAISTYPMPPVGDPEDTDIPDLVPLRRLKTRMEGDWYIDALATLPEARGRFVGHFTRRL